MWRGHTLDDDKSVVELSILPITQVVECLVPQRTYVQFRGPMTKRLYARDHIGEVTLSTGG
jgi:hypothetical protein